VTGGWLPVVLVGVAVTLLLAFLLRGDTDIEGWFDDDGEGEL
jgi:hypothetical protein